MRNRSDLLSLNKLHRLVHRQIYFYNKIDHKDFAAKKMSTKKIWSPERNYNLMSLITPMALGPHLRSMLGGAQIPSSPHPTSSLSEPGISNLPAPVVNLQPLFFSNVNPGPRASVQIPKIQVQGRQFPKITLRHRSPWIASTILDSINPSGASTPRWPNLEPVTLPSESEEAEAARELEDRMARFEESVTQREAEHQQLALEEGKRQEAIREANDSLHAQQEQVIPQAPPPHFDIWSLAPDVRPYITYTHRDQPMTRHEFRSPGVIMCNMICDSFPRQGLNQLDLLWLSKMYGARVHFANRVSTRPLRYLYITHYNVIFDNALESGYLAVYLNPVPNRISYMYAQVPNTVYVVREEVSMICPHLTVVPENRTPYGQGHRLQILVDSINDQHSYGLPLTLRTQVIAGPVGYEKNAIAYDPTVEAKVEAKFDEQRNAVPPLMRAIDSSPNSAILLTEENLQQHNAVESAFSQPTRPSSPASSVGSSGSMVKPDVIEKVDRWKQASTITGEPSSGDATGSSVLFESYVSYCGGVNKCGVKRSNDFGKYIRALWPEDERKWLKTNGTYYRGITLRK